MEVTPSEELAGYRDSIHRSELQLDITDVLMHFMETTRRRPWEEWTQSLEERPPARPSQLEWFSPHDFTMRLRIKEPSSLLGTIDFSGVDIAELTRRALSSLPLDQLKFLRKYLYSQDELAAIFNTLAERWSEQTQFTSSVDEMVMHPDYQRIIGLGRQALPLLLRELQERPNHWFWALRSIAGDDPTRQGDNFDKAVNAWLQWGKAQGYIE